VTPANPYDVQHLLLVLECGESEAKMAASKILAALGSPAVDALIPALEEGDTDFVKWAAFALGLAGDKRALEPLARAAEGADPAVRKWCLAAMDQIRFGGCGRCGCRSC